MENTYTTPESSENILDDVDYTLTQANSGRRFFNFLIDRVAIYLVWKFLLSRVNLAILIKIYQYTRSEVAIYLFTYLFYIAFFVLLQATLETFAHGKTLGKWITGTRAVNQDGTPIDGRTAILRGLSRLVPLEVFSALGSPCFPWHDRWTKTYVINERESTLPA